MRIGTVYLIRFPLFFPSSMLPDDSCSGNPRASLSAGSHVPTCQGRLASRQRFILADTLL
jgi:hypothetical protein